ncbi:hypothetical protein NliqN6_3874 [Naganishia liquefaciens]|uniref:Uncharacterized protein n=1 Tax=Naganishia liquefaciens TaxID=104408 RepID=A0A8H3TUM5_9TREE|nr:hypothetical protein NliqN6_3874 [Naganishia liquefaciens]
MKNAATASRVGSDDNQSTRTDTAADSDEEDPPLGASDGQSHGENGKRKEKSAGRKRPKPVRKPEGNKGSGTIKEGKGKGSEKSKKQVKSKEEDEPGDEDSEPEAGGDDSTDRSRRKVGRAKSAPRAQTARSRSADEARDEKANANTLRRPAQNASRRDRKAPDSSMEEGDSEESANVDIPTDKAAKRERPSRSTHAGPRSRPAEASRPVEERAGETPGAGRMGVSRSKRSAQKDWNDGDSVASTVEEEEPLTPRKRRARRGFNDNARKGSKNSGYSSQESGYPPTDSYSRERLQRRSHQDRRSARRGNTKYDSDSYLEGSTSEKTYSTYSSTGIESEKEDRAARQRNRRLRRTSEYTAEPGALKMGPEDPWRGDQGSRRQRRRPDNNTSPDLASRQDNEWYEGSARRARTTTRRTPPGPVTIGRDISNNMPYERNGKSAYRVSNAAKLDNVSSPATDEATSRESAPSIRRSGDSRFADGSGQACMEPRSDRRKASSQDSDTVRDVASKVSQRPSPPAYERISPAEQATEGQNRNPDHRREKKDNHNGQIVGTTPDDPSQSPSPSNGGYTEMMSPSLPREESTKAGAKHPPDEPAAHGRMGKAMLRKNSGGPPGEEFRAEEISDTAHHGREAEEPLSHRGNMPHTSQTSWSSGRKESDRSHASPLESPGKGPPARGKQQKEHGDSAGFSSSPPTSRSEPRESEKMDPAAVDNPEKNVQGRSIPGSSTGKAQGVQTSRQRSHAEQNHASPIAPTRTSRDADKVESKPAKEGVKTYFAEDGKGPPSLKRGPASPQTVAPSKPSKETKDRPAGKLTTPGQSRHERKQAERETPSAQDAAHQDTDCAVPGADSPKGFWRSVKDGFRNARQHKAKTFLCLLLSIGYVVATGYGQEYGRSASTGSSAPRLEARADSVAAAVESAGERLKDVNVSRPTFQDHFLAISILWHVVLQLCIVFLLSDIIAPPRQLSSDTTSHDDATPRPASRWRTSRDRISATYHRILRDPLSRAYRTTRRASKWTFIRLALIAFLALTMLLVARQLSSLAHIAADPHTSRAWSDAPDVRWLHASLRAHISQLGADGGKILAASWGFWGMTGTALVYCISALADRPVEAPVDEEMGMGEVPAEADRPGKAP